MKKCFDTNDKLYLDLAPRIKRKHTIIIRGCVQLHKVAIKKGRFTYYFYVANDYVNNYQIAYFLGEKVVIYKLRGNKKYCTYIIDNTQIILPYEWDTIRIKYGKKNYTILGKLFGLVTSIFIWLFDSDCVI